MVLGKFFSTIMPEHKNKALLLHFFEIVKPYILYLNFLKYLFLETIP